MKFDSATDILVCWQHSGKDLLNAFDLMKLLFFKSVHFEKKKHKNTKKRLTDIPKLSHHYIYK